MTRTYDTGVYSHTSSLSANDQPERVATKTPEADDEAKVAATVETGAVMVEVVMV